MDARPLIAHFSPLPPARTGVADYCRELLPELSRAYDVQAFHGNEQTVSKTLSEYSAGEYAWRARKSFQLHIHQMGNSDHHGFQLPFAFLHPGLLVLHERVLHHGRAKYRMEREQLTRYLNETRACYPREGETVGRWVSMGLFGDPLFFRFPLCEDLASRSRAVLVHSRHNQEWLRSRGIKRVFRTPMGATRPKIDRDRVRGLKERYGFRPDHFVVASFGFVNPSKRMHATLGALSLLAEKHPEIRFLVAGSEPAGMQTLTQAAGMGLGDRVTVTGFIDPEEFDDHLGLPDACVNLRFPSAGETSVMLLKILAAGVPVFVTDSQENEEMPAEAAPRVSLMDESRSLAAGMETLINDPEKRRAQGEAGRAYYERHHTMEVMMRGYRRVIDFLVDESRTCADENTASEAETPNHLRSLSWSYRHHFLEAARSLEPWASRRFASLGAESHEGATKGCGLLIAGSLSPWWS